MATLGTQALTFADYRKRMTPDGKIDWIIDVMSQSNPIMQHIKWKEGNLPTGNQTTLRTSYPHPQLRRINRGITPGKSTTRQIVDTCCIMEAYSEVDVRLVQMAPDKEGLRRSEDAAFVEGFTQDLANIMFYGDTDKNPDEFYGLGVRLNTFNGDKGTFGYQTVNAGGTTADKQTSIYIVEWGDKAVSGIYPKGSKLGLQMEDKGEQIVTDEDGGKYPALMTWFAWDAGLAVENLRKVAAVRNIDMAKAVTETTADYRKKLVEKFVVAKNRIQNPKNPIAYVSDDIYTLLELHLNDKQNVYVTRQELMNAMPKIYVSGIEISKCDALRNTEPVITDD